MHIEADRALIPAHVAAVRHLSITVTAPARPELTYGDELLDGSILVARDVVVELTCSRGAEVVPLNGVPSEASHGRVRVMLGDLVGREEVRLAFAISIAPQLVEAVPFVDCRVTDRDGRFHQEPVRVEWRATDPRESDRQPVNHAVLVMVAAVLAERARVTARAAVARGDVDDARRVLRDIIEHLFGLAPGHRQIVDIIDGLGRAELDLLP